MNAQLNMHRARQQKPTIRKIRPIYLILKRHEKLSIMLILVYACNIWWSVHDFELHGRRQPTFNDDALIINREFACAFSFSNLCLAACSSCRFLASSFARLLSSSSCRCFSRIRPTCTLAKIILADEMHKKDFSIQVTEYSACTRRYRNTPAHWS
jgi:hypothetical protein